MNILIVFATTEGQTRKIAKFSANLIGGLGHEVTLLESGSHARDADINSFDAVFVAASVHQESHQETIVDFVFAHRKFLQDIPTAFVSVSLSAVMENSFKDAQTYLDRFQSITKWQPDRSLLLGGAVRFTKYDYFKRQIVEHIVMSGGAASPMGDDFEFTDWDCLKRFVEDFVAFATK